MPDKPSYRAAHNHVRAARGNAETHTCACGQPAQEWGFKHVSSSVLLDPDGRPYSDNPNDYSPLCLTCHRRYDRETTPERFMSEVVRVAEDPATKDLARAWVDHVKKEDS